MVTLYFSNAASKQFYLWLHSHAQLQKRDALQWISHATTHHVTSTWPPPILVLMIKLQDGIALTTEVMFSNCFEYLTLQFVYMWNKFLINQNHDVYQGCQIHFSWTATSSSIWSQVGWTQTAFPHSISLLVHKNIQKVFTIHESPTHNELWVNNEYSSLFQGGSTLQLAVETWHRSEESFKMSSAVVEATDATAKISSSQQIQMASRQLQPKTQQLRQLLIHNLIFHRVSFLLVDLWHWLERLQVVAFSPRWVW